MIDNRKECRECNEDTKFPTGFWDGFDKSGNMIGGCTFDCNNMNCLIKQERAETKRKEELNRADTHKENALNGIDIKEFSRMRKERRCTIMDCSKHLGVRPSMYSGYELERLPIPPEHYGKMKNYFESIEPTDHTTPLQPEK